MFIHLFRFKGRDFAPILVSYALKWYSDGPCASFGELRTADIAKCAKPWTMLNSHDNTVADDQPAMVDAALSRFVAFVRLVSRESPGCRLSVKIVASPHSVNRASRIDLPSLRRAGVAIAQTTAEYFLGITV
jgi:hypothetical protein